MADTSEKRKIRVAKRYVPPELAREISVRHPCKSLARFKSVSKLFSSFLYDMDFIDEHRKDKMKPSHYLIWDTDEKKKLHVFSLSRDKYSHTKTINTQKFKIASQSSYGLVCLHGFHSKSIALLNPVSGEMISLPNLPMPFSYDKSEGVPDSLHSDIGFGFDLKSRKYKIVQFVLCTYTNAIARCYVLTVNNGSSWREINVSNHFENIYFAWRPIYANGVLYWELPSSTDDVHVFAFDLSTEQMRVIETPTKYVYYSGFRLGKQLTSLEGKLCCLHSAPSSLDDTSLFMKIWKLDHGYGTSFDAKVSWVLSYKLDIYGFSSGLYPLYIDEWKRIVFESEDDLYRYDVRSKSLERYPVTEKIEGVACHTHSNLSTIHSETIPTPMPVDDDALTVGFGKTIIFQGGGGCGSNSREVFILHKKIAAWLPVSKAVSDCLYSLRETA